MLLTLALLSWRLLMADTLNDPSQLPGAEQSLTKSQQSHNW